MGNEQKGKSLYFSRFISCIMLCLLQLLCVSQAATPFTIAKSQYTDSVSITSEFVSLNPLNPGTNLQIEFYVWISPLVANSLISDMQLIRLSSQQILNRTNEVTTKVLLISINETKLKIESILSTTASIATQSFKLKDINANLRGWNQVSIAIKDLSYLEIRFANVLICTIPATVLPISYTSLYMYVGQEQAIDLLPFSGYYAYQGSFVNSNLDPLTTPSLWLNEGWSNKLISIRSLGTPLRKSFSSSDNLIIEDYSAKFSLKLLGTFLLKRQIFRLTLNDDVYDDRRLGYCICCVYVQNRILEFETYSYDLTNGLVNKSEKLSNNSLDLGKYYDITISFDWGMKKLSIYLNGVKIKDISSTQLAMQNFQLIYGGDFKNDSFFSGKIKNIIVNYGVNSLASSSLTATTVPVCDKDTCASCLISSLSICEDCLISLGDINRDPSVDCDCQSSFYFNSNEVCMNCHYTCAACTGASNVECSSCISSRSLDLSTNKCLCNTKTYDDGINSTCLACHPDCVTCLSGNSNQCTSCEAKKEVDPTGSCVCTTGYTMVGGTCTQCRGVCKKCNASGDCTACRENFELLSGNCACKEGYRLNENKCIPCPNNCLQCTVDTCQRCKPRFEPVIVSNGQNSAECTERKYIPGSTSWNGSSSIFDYIILSLLIIDLIATIFVNQFSFSRVFRLWQFLTKLFLLKLVEGDFTEANYNLISSLTHFNGISFFFPSINIFGSSSSTTFFSTKTKFEGVQSSIMSSTGGQLFLLLTLVIIVSLTTLISRFSNGNPSKNRPQSSSIVDESFRMDHPLNQDTQQLNKPTKGENNIEPYPSLLSKITSSLQFIFWHFQELLLQLLCLGLVLNYVDILTGGQSFNFMCIIVPIYVLGVSLLIRSFLILKPKIPLNLLYYKQIAVSNERKMAAKKIKIEKEKEKELVPRQDQDESMIILNGYNSNSSSDADLHPTPKPLRLSDSNCFRGLFRCLHMEFIPGYKSCKFFFWFYILSYIFIVLSVFLPKGSSKNQYLLLMVFQFVFVVTSLFRPYQDIIESVKNIIDNIAFLLTIILQSVMSENITENAIDFRLTQDQIDFIDRYSYSSFSIVLIAIVSITILSIYQAIKNYKNSLPKKENTDDDSKEQRQPIIHQFQLDQQLDPARRTHETIVADIDNGLIEMVAIDQQDLGSAVAGKYSELQYLPGSSFTKELDMKRVSSGDYSRTGSFYQTSSQAYRTQLPGTNSFETDKRQYRSEGNLINIFSSASERGNIGSLLNIESSNLNSNAINNNNSNAVRSFNSNSATIKQMESIKEEEVPQPQNTIKGLFKPFTELHDVQSSEQTAPSSTDQEQLKSGREKEQPPLHEQPSKQADSIVSKESPQKVQPVPNKEIQKENNEQQSEDHVEERDQSLSLDYQSPDLLLNESYSSAYFPI